MTTTTLTFTINGDPVTADFTIDTDASAFYTFDDDHAGIAGVILAKPSRYGLHPQHGVMLTLGGYGPKGQGGGWIDLGDWAIGGSLICSGPDLKPQPVGDGAQYPLDKSLLDSDPDTADWLTQLVAAISDHYITHYTGDGLA